MESTGVVVPFILSQTLNQLETGVMLGFFSPYTKTKLVYFQLE